MGYARAGFEVVGVDIKPQPRYPFEFHLADALSYPLDGFDMIHASPPCQDYCTLHALYPDKEYPDLIAPVRERLLASERPWVMENVMTAPLHYGVMLCGTMFGLRAYRHRRFETSHLLWQPMHPKHLLRTGAGKGQTQRKAHYLAGNFVTVTGNVGSYAGEAMGIDWMTGAQLSQAIPPAYTEYLARQLLAVIDRAA